MAGVMDTNTGGTSGTNAGGIIQGIAELASSGVNYASQQKTNKSNADENEKAREFNLMLWKMQNDYNTPSAQMARYVAAGLNPSLIYGSGSSSAGNASAPAAASPVRFNAPQFDMPNLVGVMQGIQQLKNAEIDNLNKQYQVGITKEQYKKAMLENYYNFNGAPIWFSNIAGPGKFAWVSADIGKATPEPPYVQLLNQKIRGMNTANNLNDELTKLRQQEVEMSGQLKQYNLTANDSIFARLFVNYLNRPNSPVKKIGDLGNSLLNHIPSSDYPLH